MAAIFVQPPLQLAEGVAQPLARLAAVRGGEQRADERAERVVLVRAHVAAEIAQKVHGVDVPARGAAGHVAGSVKNIVANRVYLGEARQGELVNTGAHEPLVSLDVFRAANANRGVGPTKRNTRLLVGLVRCWACR